MAASLEGSSDDENACLLFYQLKGPWKDKADKMYILGL